VLHEHFHRTVHVAFLIKPDNFWQKQRTSLGKQKKYNFEVIKFELFCMRRNSNYISIIIFIFIFMYNIIGIYKVNFSF